MKRLMVVLFLIAFATVGSFATDKFEVKHGSGFIENKGQFRDQSGNSNPDVLYSKDFGWMKVQLRRDGFSYEVYQVKPKWVNTTTNFCKTMTINEKGDTLIGLPGMLDTEKELMYHYHRVDVGLINCNPNTVITAEGVAGAKRQHVYAERNETVKISDWLKVRYHNIYPGIDLQFYSNSDQGTFKYDFILKPGADMSQIVLEYNGADQIKIDPNGSLSVATRFETWEETIPLCYFEDESGNKQEVNGINYKLTRNKLSFAGTINDFHGELVIDPMIFRCWGTYFGGEADESANDIKIDSSGNIFVCGTTNSAQNIATSGAYQDSLTLPNDGFLAKFSNNGDLIWSTYLGGVSANQMDLSGNTIVMAGSHICSFDTGGNFNWSRGGIGISTTIAIDINGDILASSDSVVKFSASGMRLWGLKYGDPTTYITGIVTGDNGCFYITGNTKDSTGIATAGSSQPVYQGNCGALSYYYFASTGPPFGDGFVSKFSAEGTLIWGTYIGGENADIGRAIALDKQGNIVVTGETNSLEGISTEGAYRTINSPNATNFQRSYSCFGCSDPCAMFITGCNFSIPYCTWMRPALVFDSLHPHQLIDGFVMKFSPSGEKLWGSYFGGTGEEFPRAIITDTLSNIIVGGYTSSVSQFDFENSMYQNPPSGSGWLLMQYTSFLISFNPAGNGINWQSDFAYAVYLSQNEAYKGTFTKTIAFDHHQDIFIAGSATLSQYLSQIASPGANKDTLEGGSDAFIARITALDADPQPVTYLTPCFGDTLVLVAVTSGLNNVPISFQWYKNDSLLFDETENTLLLNGISESDSGYYTCEITRDICSWNTPGYHIFPRETPVFDTLHTGQINERVTVADLNDDGKMDLVGNLNVYYNLGDQFQISADSTPIDQDFFMPYDFDGDGDVDILGMTHFYVNHNDSLSKISLNANVNCWGDFDNDGDIDGIDLSSSKMLKNNLGVFEKTNISRGGSQYLFPPSLGKSADMDYDGDMDMVIFSGNIIKDGQIISTAKYGVWYENRQNQWVQQDIVTNFVFSNVSFDVADFNGDYYPDVAVSTRQGYDLVTQVYRNDQNIFTKTAQSLYPGIAPVWPHHPRVQCADFDNDGDMDFISGTEFFKNTLGGFERFPTTYSQNASTGVTARYYNVPADLDNNGYLELANGPMVFNASLCSLPNQKPSAPVMASLTSSQDTISIQWSEAVDDLTPTSGLTYNLKIGSQIHSENIMPSNSDSAGFRKIATQGNAGQHLTWQLRDLPEGNYYVSIQAIDHHFQGSAFSPVDSFTIVRPPVILSGPVNQFFCPGDSLAMKIHATSLYPLAYQWYRNGSVLPGQTDSALVFNEIQFSDSGYYQCRVSNFGHCSITDSVFIEVLLPFEFKNDMTFWVNSVSTYPSGNGVWLDINQDNRLDLLMNVYSGQSQSRCYMNADSLFINLNWFSYYSNIGLMLVDWNRDNIPDFLTPANDKVKISLISNLLYTQFELSYPYTYLASFAPGDYDNDGDLDIYICGGSTSSWYAPAIGWLLTNVNGVLIPNDTAFSPLHHGDSKWVDIDNDGDLDMIMCGATRIGSWTYYHTDIYNNVDGVFQLNPSLIPGKSNGRIETADYDNDGDQDLIITSAINPTYSPQELRIYKNQNGIFTDSQISMPSASGVVSFDLDNDGNPGFFNGTGYYEVDSSGLSRTATVPFGGPGDFNNDGRLDFFHVSFIKRNEDCGIINTPPTAPIDPVSTLPGDRVVFTWGKATDGQTPQNGIMYNIRVGTFPGGNDIVTSLADPQTGFRYVAQKGNMQQSTTYYLKGLEPGTYYWAIQAIDNGFLGGPFAPEQSFTIVPQVPVNLTLANDTVAEGETLCFDATNTITVGGGGSRFKVQGGAAVTMIAGEKVLFLPTVQVDSGGYLHGYITATNEYCFQAMQPMVQTKLSEISADESGLIESAEAPRLVKVYPNPTSGTLNILVNTSSNEAVRLVVYNLIGAIVFEEETTSEMTVISLGDLSPGIYLLRVIQGHGSEVVKVIKI